MTSEQNADTLETEKPKVFPRVSRYAIFFHISKNTGFSQILAIQSALAAKRPQLLGFV